MSLEILTSALLAGTRHGFFTRRGGASSGIYAGLNCGPGSADQSDAVAINLARAAAALEVPPERLLSLHQTHTTTVAVAGPDPWPERPRADVAWRERRVAHDGGRHAFAWASPRPDAALDARFPHLPDGAIAETSPAGEAVAALLGARIAARGGAALVIDYGAAEGHGDTLQALRRHAPVDPLDAPGTADLTAHVRFGALARAARPARASGPVPQGAFLEALGITARARALAKGRSGAEVDAIAAAHRRLTHPDEMGNLLRVLALAPEDAGPLPGFDR
jgi:hypothetical protein